MPTKLQLEQQILILETAVDIHKADEGNAQARYEEIHAVIRSFYMDCPGVDREIDCEGSGCDTYADYFVKTPTRILVLCGSCKEDLTCVLGDFGIKMPRLLVS